MVLCLAFPVRAYRLYLSRVSTSEEIFASRGKKFLKQNVATKTNTYSSTVARLSATHIDIDYM